jgi:hypothetical protein
LASGAALPLLFAAQEWKLLAYGQSMNLPVTFIKKTLVLGTGRLLASGISLNFAPMRVLSGQAGSFAAIQ